MFIKAKLKTEEERINNNIMTGAKTALKVAQFNNGSRSATKLDFVDYNISLNSHDAFDKEIKTFRSQFDILKSNGVDPIKFITEKEQEALNGKQ